VKTLSTAPVRYVPIGRPCVSCDQLGYSISYGYRQITTFDSYHCQKSQKSLNVKAVITRVIPAWCPNVLHVMIASGEQN
jgi:hypothetical protein